MSGKRSALIREAEMQMKALKTIGMWRTTALAVSASGVLLGYAGFSGMVAKYYGWIGVVLAVIGLIIAMIIHRGIENGRRNVQKILNAGPW